MTRVAVVVRARSHMTAFHERVAATFESLGFPSELVPDGSASLAQADVAFFTGSANWYPGSHRRLSEHARRDEPRVVFWHTEPLPLPAAAHRRVSRLHARELAKIALRDPRRSDPRSNVRGLERVLGLLDVLVVSTYERKLFLAERGVVAEFVPIGYDEIWHGRDLQRERDIDVLFLGALEVPRRKRIIERLRRDGVDVRALGNWNDPSLWGEQRVELLNRTKILLNLPRHAGMLSGGRMLLGMANKALIVAEPIFDPRPYVPGTHFVSGEPDELADVVTAWLGDEERRRTVTHAAYAFVTTRLTLSQSLARIASLF